VAVEDGLAVFDALGEPAGGDRVPALLLGEFAGCRHDEALALRPFAFLAFLYRHHSLLAPLDKRAAAALASPHHLVALDFKRVIMLNALEVVTTVVVGVMVGVEFSVAFVMNPILNALPEDSGQLGHARGGRMLGAVMPVWYIGSLVLVGIWAVAEWHHNNRNKTWTPDNRPEDWKEQMNRWDRFHYVRVAVIIVAFALLVAALT
jgi:hypothetical protein